MNKYYKQILGCQTDFTVTDKYLKKVHIRNWRKPCIYLCNEDPCDYGGVDDKWIDGNCTTVEIKKLLFIETSPPGTPGSSQSMLCHLIVDIEEDSDYN